MFPREFKHVSSSMIRGVAYDPEDSTLYVEFMNGVVWEYNDVPESLFDGFFTGSAGNHFNTYIKNSFDGKEV